MKGITSPTTEDLRGGIVKSYGDGWFIWHRTWNERLQYTRKRDELDIIYRDDYGHEAIKMMFMGADGYEVGDDEQYLDDLEDEALDNWRYRITETDDESEEEERAEEESDEDMDSD